MQYKDRLVLDLRDTWRKLADSEPSKSSHKNLFVDFLEFVCEYMGIDKKGLKRRHLNLP